MKNSFVTFALALVSVGGVALAAPGPIPRPLPTRPPVPGPGPVPVPIPMPIPQPPIGGDGADARIRAKLEGYVARKARLAVSDADFAAAGLSPEHDFREQAQVINGKRFTPFHAGKLLAVKPGDVRPSTKVDPGLTSVFRATLTSRLGRAPTSAELQEEIRVFDSGIARQNEQLAAARSEIAGRYAKDGEIPRDIDHRWMNVEPTDKARADLHKYEAEWSKLVSALMTSAVSQAAPAPVPRPTFTPRD